MLHGKRAITPEYALLIEAALGIESGFWLRMQMEYDLIVAKRSPQFLEKLKKVSKYAAVL